MTTTKFLSKFLEHKATFKQRIPVNKDRFSGPLNTVWLYILCY